MNFNVLVAGIFTGFMMPCLLMAQQTPDPEIEQIIEFIAENASEEQDYSELTERLVFYRKHPLNINEASKEQLMELVFISPIQITNLLNYRTNTGLFLDLLELQSIAGFDLATVQRLLVFVELAPPGLFEKVSLKTLVDQGEHDLMIRFGRILQTQRGFLNADSAAYQGSPLRVFTRYRFSYADKIAASLNMEKDAGEHFLKGRAKGFDFYSANIYLTGKRLVRKWVLGDYALQFGQGLSMWSGLSFGKGAAFAGIAKQDIGLRPYSSINESSFLRGMAATLQSQRFSLSPFFSYKKLDASISADGNVAKSLPVSGLHRTETELRGKNRLAQTVFGLNAHYRSAGLSAGLIFYETRLSIPLAAGESMYQKYHFKGSALRNGSIYFSYPFKNSYFFGEAAHNPGGNSAFLGGLMASISEQMSVSLLYRNYARNYHSFFNRAISESTEAMNEKGLYAGFVFRLNSKFEFTSYVDAFSFPWLKFRVDAPSVGHEAFAQLTYTLNRRFKIAGRVKSQVRQENVENIPMSSGLEEVNRSSYRLELSCKLSNSFSVRNRAELALYKKGEGRGEAGFLCYQDIIYDPLNSRLSGNLRFAIFDTPGFNSRIYAYENDVLFGYSVPAYQNRGLRYYANARYSINRSMDVWLRYALSSFTNQETVGSGNDIIYGNQRADLKVQLRIQF